MTHPHHSPHHGTPPEGGTPQAGDAFQSLRRALDAAVDRDVSEARSIEARSVQAAPRPASAPPGGSAGGGGGRNVGPHHPARVQPDPVKSDFTLPRRALLANPLEQLVEVVEEAYRLRQEVELLIASITGEVPVAVGRMQPSGPVCGLLPNVARLASEIGAVHGQISERVEQALGRLG